MDKMAPMITPVSVLLILCCQLLVLVAEDTFASAASGEFSRHTVARPRFFQASKNSEIAHTRRNDTGHRHHLDQITVRVEVDGGKELVLDLALNKHLIPDTYFEKYHEKVGNTLLNFLRRSNPLLIVSAKNIISSLPSCPKNKVSTWHEHEVTCSSQVLAK